MSWPDRAQTHNTFPFEGKLIIDYMPNNTVRVELHVLGMLLIDSGETLVEALVRLTKLHFQGIEWQKNTFFSLCVLAGVTDPELESFFDNADG